MKTGAQGEAFTRNILYFKRLSANRRKNTRGATFTHNPLTLSTLQTKSEEVKAKNRKTPDARASRVRVGRSPCANLRPSWAGDEKTSLGAPPSREKIVTSQGAHLPSSRTWGHRPNTTQSAPLFLPLFPMTTTAPQLLPYLERLLDGETVEWKTLGEVAEIGTGSSNRQDEEENGLYPLIPQHKFL